jgi:hypothetical protein
VLKYKSSFGTIHLVDASKGFRANTLCAESWDSDPSLVEVDVDATVTCGTCLAVQVLRVKASNKVMA